MRKKLFAILLAFAMLAGILAGCAAEEATVSEAPQSEAPASEAPVSEAPASEAPAETEAVPEPEPELTRDHVSLPISEELVTLTMWYTWPPVLSAFSEGPGIGEFWQELENRTNVHLECQNVSTESASTQFNLMVVAGEYPDMGLGCKSYYLNPDQAVEDEVFLDIAPYVDELMPNFKCLVASNEDYYNAVYTDGGAVVELPKFIDEKANNIGPVTRADWLEKLGMDVPVTYTELETALLAFKDELGCQNGMLTPYTGFQDTIAAGYGVPASVEGAFYVVDGEVKFTGLEQDYYDFITLMAKWYSQGIIDHEFLSRTTTTDPDQGLIFGGNAGLWTMNALMFDTYLKSSGSEEFAIQALPTPVKEEGGGIITSADAAQVTEGGYNIFSTCSNVEAALKYCDYGYSEEGSEFYNFGIEGIGWEYDGDGVKHLKSEILQSPMGLPSSLTLAIYQTNMGPFLENVSRCYYFFSDAQKDAMALWNTSDWPSISTTFPSNASLSVEDSETYSNIMGDVNTYMEETVLGVVVGNFSADTLPDMQATLESLNIQEALDLQQAAYDSYMEK